MQDKSYRKREVVDKNIAQKVKSKVIEIFDKYLGQDYILFLFGSFARGNFDRTSDIDLAVYSKEKIPSSLFARIRAEIEDKISLLRDIDLVNLTEDVLSVELLARILKEGVLWKKARNWKELLTSLKRCLENLRR